MKAIILARNSKNFNTKKGTPSFKVVYSPKLDYAKGKTKNYIKKNFIVSVLDEDIYETLFLYSNIDKKSILDSKEVFLTKLNTLIFLTTKKLIFQALKIHYLSMKKQKCIG